MNPNNLILFLLSILFIAKGQTNLVTNGGFEIYTSCPNFGGQWNYCTGWNNTNGNTGIGFWGSPDYYNYCGSGGYAPPSMNGGTCVPHLGSAMMGLVMYNVPYPEYREYLSTQLNAPMQPGTTYTLSFWLTNGTGIKSPWTIRNIGVCFSASSLTQPGYTLIPAVPQCEITSNVATTVWTKYTFTINPSSIWNYLTIGAFRPDAANSPTMFFPNPGGNYSVYSHYFLDDIEVLAPTCATIVSSSADMCSGGTPVTFTASGGTNYTWSPSSSLSAANGSVVIANPNVTTTYSLIVAGSACTGSAIITVNVISVSVTPSSTNMCTGGTPVTFTASGGVTYTWSPSSSLSAANGSVVIANPNVTTTYSVITAGNTCTASTVITLSVTSVSVTTSAQSFDICRGSSVNVSAGGASSFTWDPGGITGSTVFLNPIVSTIYTVTGSSGPCTGSTSANINVAPLPTVAISGPTAVICSGQSASLVASGANSYTWNTGQQGAGISVSPVVTTTYSVSGLNAERCEDQSVFTVSVTGCQGIKEHGDRFLLTIYPNPVRDVLFIERPQGLEIEQITVLNAMGVQVSSSGKQQPAYSGQGTLKTDLSHLDKGIYFLKIKSRNQEFIYKVIKD